ncbi:MAG: hypothetical protein R6V13_05510 [Anaerolineae bacterium]
MLYAAHDPKSVLEDLAESKQFLTWLLNLRLEGGVEDVVRNDSDSFLRKTSEAFGDLSE